MTDEIVRGRLLVKCKTRRITWYEMANQSARYAIRVKNMAAPTEKRNAGELSNILLKSADNGRKSLTSPTDK